MEPSKSETVIAHDGLRLRLYSFRSPQKMDAAVVGLHDVGSTGREVAWLAPHLRSRNLAFFSFDARGHGLSEGIPGHLGHFGEAAVDLTTILDFLRDRVGSAPVFGFGHGFGGLVLAHAICQPERSLKAAVLQNPLFAFGSGWKDLRIGFFGAFQRALAEFRHLLGDRRALQDLGRGATFRTSWFRETLAAQTRLREIAQYAACPVLLQIKEEDTQIKKSAVLDFASALHTNPVVQFFPGAGHRFTEGGREEEEWAFFSAYRWLVRVCPALAHPGPLAGATG